MITREQRAIAKADLTIGKKLGLPATSWDVVRATGDGVTADALPSLIGAWTGYVADEQAQRGVVLAPSVDAGGKRWYAVGTSSDVVLTGGGAGTLQADDVLLSDIYAFMVLSAETVAGYARYLVRPVAISGYPTL